jgi:hypothetical protein
MARLAGAIDRFLTIWTDRIVAKKARDAASNTMQKLPFWGNLRLHAKCVSPKASTHKGVTGNFSCSFMRSGSETLALGV